MKDKIKIKSLLVSVIFLIQMSGGVLNARSLSVGNFHTQYICADSAVMSCGLNGDDRLGMAKRGYLYKYMRIST